MLMGAVEMCLLRCGMTCLWRQLLSVATKLLTPWSTAVTFI